MKTVRSVIALFILLVFVSGDEIRNGYRSVKNRSFQSGEVLTYKVHYGFISAATAELTISDKLYRLNDRKCYKIEVMGRSVGMFDLFLRIRDTWGTYLDTSAIITHKFYRKIEEGKYRKNEVVEFDHESHMAYSKSFDNRKQQWKPTKTFEVPDNVQDLVSAYYYIRTLNFKELKEGEIISIDTFFDEELYDFSIKFVGREVVKTKLGKIRSLVLSPIMPENSLFDGENAIRFWISDDVNKVPLKVKAELLVGAVEIDIQSFKKGVK
ncbi:DUF3108 domain-containing protein [Fulvivirga sp. M361]|uniref:DUF3108 domain-containing protein n=1 Tax=Fulvivirga sp. M361 TaxID=2594266 RepID=UPI00117BD50F|nr:DUF3108 domain-containing protein [Fulvivirga sp. M361]TRX56232.1 DUF3108 domain-containing protein [Fulvivirga sp. M361]